MLSAIHQFRANMARVRALGGLHNALYRLTTPAVDSTDILRAQIVLAVSALDHYVHELARLGMLEVFAGLRPSTNAFGRFQVSLDAAMLGASGKAGGAWLESEIRERHSFLAFQHPDKIADAVRLFSSCELWPQVSLKIGSPVQTTKDRLRLIVDRRNKIAHEADLDPSYPGQRWPISPADVESTIKFIESICEAIQGIV